MPSPEQGHTSHLKHILYFRPKGEQWDFPAPGSAKPLRLGFRSEYDQNVGRRKYREIVLDCLAQSSQQLNLFDEHKWDVQEGEDHLDIVFHADRVPRDFTHAEERVGQVFNYARFLASVVITVRTRDSGAPSAT